MRTNALLTLAVSIGFAAGLPASTHHQYSKNAFPVLLAPLNSVADANPFEGFNALRNTEPSPEEMRGIIRNLVDTLAKAYQQLINRQQQLLNYFYCTDCISRPSPVQSFLQTLSKIPLVNLLVRSDQQEGQATFITATHVDGVISGAGGTIVDSKPKIEFTFQNPVETDPEKESVSVDRVHQIVPAIFAPDFGEETKFRIMSS